MEDFPGELLVKIEALINGSEEEQDHPLLTVTEYPIAATLSSFATRMIERISMHISSSSMRMESPSLSRRSDPGYARRIDLNLTKENECPYQAKCYRKNRQILARIWRFLLE